jgi:hypothetical protein
MAVSDDEEQGLDGGLTHETTSKQTQLIDDQVNQDPKKR